MSNLSRLLGITALGASFVKTRLIKRFLSDIASVITLAIATGLLAGALLMACFYAIYQTLRYYGLDAMPSEACVIALGFATVALLASRIGDLLRHLQNIPEQIVRTELPLSGHLNTMMDSFMDGLLTQSDTPSSGNRH